MARQKSEFLKAMGTGWEIFMAIVNEVLSLDGNDEHLRRILTSKTLRRQIAQMIVDSIPKASKIITMMFTRLIPGAENLTIGPTMGWRTIAQAKNVFTGYIDPNFKDWGIDVPSETREDTKVEVRELYRDATFAQMFGELNQSIDELLLTQDEIIDFVLKHREHIRHDGCATFFLFKVNGEVFVAYVFVDDDGDPGSYVSRFSNDSVWGGSDLPRMVVPQQKLGV